MLTNGASKIKMFLDDYGYRIYIINVPSMPGESSKELLIDEGSLNYSLCVRSSGAIEKHGDVIFLFDALSEGNGFVSCLINDQTNDLHPHEDVTIFIKFD